MPKRPKKAAAEEAPPEVAPEAPPEKPKRPRRRKAEDAPPADPPAEVPPDPAEVSAPPRNPDLYPHGRGDWIVLAIDRNHFGSTHRVLCGTLAMGRSVTAGLFRLRAQIGPDALRFETQEDAQAFINKSRDGNFLETRDQLVRYQYVPLNTGE